METTAVEFLKRLVETPSPSGFEVAGQRVWMDYVRAHAEAVQQDAYGNVFATLHEGGTPRVLVSGHADEIALMVSYINDDGFLYFKAIGGINVGILRGQRVVVHSKKGTVQGVIGSQALHLTEADDRKKVPEMHDMYIDIGVRSAEEAKELVAIGNPVTLAAGYWSMAGGRVAARGCDNRIGSWAAAEVIRRVAQKRSQLKACLLSASTIQEENGLYGAHMLGYRLHPDVAVVIDVTHATDTPSHSKAKHGAVQLGGGPVLSIGSANHPVLVERFQQVAEKIGIAVQVEVNPRSTGTDADAIFLQRGGIPTICLGLPNRYMHSPVEVIDLQDLDDLAELVAAFVLDVQAGEQFSVTI